MYEIENLAFSKTEVEAADAFYQSITLNTHQDGLSNTENNPVSFFTAHDRTFTNVVWAGHHIINSTITNCEFIQSTFSDTNMKYGNFTESTFNVDAKSTSFDHSEFSFAKLEQCTFEGCSFADTYFYNEKINQCEFMNVEFTNAIFRKVSFDGIDFTNASFDNARFYDCIFTGCTFPFFKSLHIAFGLSEIIASGTLFQTEGQTHTAKNESYRSEVHTLIPKFCAEKDHLALSSIFIMEGETSKCFSNILDGIQTNGNRGDFQSIYALCSIASENNLFTKKQLKQLFYELEHKINMKALSYVERGRYTKMLVNVREILLDQKNADAHIEIEVDTAFDYTDMNRLSETQNMILQVPESIDADLSCKITVRHNSPINLMVDIYGNPYALLFCYSIITMLISGTIKSIKEIQKIILNHEDIKLKKIEVAIKEAEYEKLCKTRHESILLPEDFKSVSYMMIQTFPDFPKSLLEKKGNSGIE